MMAAKWCIRATVWRAVLAAAAVAHAQPQTAEPHAAFAGTVRDAITGEPLNRAMVRLEGKLTYQAGTDASGAFHFPTLAPDGYRIAAVRPGYEKQQSAKLKDGSTAAMVRFAAGDNIADAEIALKPHGHISGRVLDTDGNPVASAEVTAVRAIWGNGFRRYEQEGYATADAEGGYQLSVSAGQFYVRATAARGNPVPQVFATGPGGREMTMATVVYPNATSVERGAALEVRPGQQTGSIDFKLGWVPAYHLRGSVSANGQTFLMLRRQPDGLPAAVIVNGRDMRPDGSFEVAGIQSGRYMLERLMGDSNLPEVPVEVTDRDVNGLAIRPVTGLDVSGHTRMEGEGAHRPPRIGARKLPERRQDGRFAGIKADGSFIFRALPPGRYVLSPESDSGLYVQSITVGGREAPGGIFDLSSGAVGEVEMVLAQAKGQVDGKVRSKGSIPEAVAVLVAAGETGNTGARSAAVDQYGRFQFGNVPPGHYYIFAVAEFEEGLWQNGDFVAAMASQGSAVDVPKNGSVQAEAAVVTADDLRRAADGVAH